MGNFRKQYKEFTLSGYKAMKTEPTANGGYLKTHPHVTIFLKGSRFGGEIP